MAKLVHPTCADFDLIAAVVHLQYDIIYIMVHTAQTFECTASL